MKFSNWNIICFAQKEPIKVQFFRLLSVLMNVHPNPHAIFEITRSGFPHILHHCSVSWKITHLYCCSSNLRQKGHIKKKFIDFWAVGRKFTKFLMSYLKPQVSFFFFFFSILHHSLASWEISDFRLLTWNFTQFSLW